jgi:hypothetical protein
VEKKSQHYEWLVPVYYKSTESNKADDDVKTFYLEARTTTVFRSLVPSVKELDFGEIPVANRNVMEILVKNVGYMEESLRMEPLTPFGGFSVLNALRTLKPGETKPIVVQFEPFSKQMFEERLMIYSNNTVVSVLLKGIGVMPEVEVNGVPDNLLSFGNVMQNEFIEKGFTIKNISSFSVTFNLASQVQGVDNKSHMAPFTLVPATATIKPGADYPVKIIYQPDHPSNHYFNVILVDIPNQIKPKQVFLRGWCYPRQLFVREHEPFEWKPLDMFKRKYEDQLKIISGIGMPVRQRIVLEFVREEEVNGLGDNQYEKEKNKFRRLVVGSCKLLDNKLEKAGTYELVPGVS